jgi:hypothetical protein
MGITNEQAFHDGQMSAFYCIWNCRCVNVPVAIAACWPDSTKPSHPPASVKLLEINPEFLRPKLWIGACHGTLSNALGLRKGMPSFQRRPSSARFNQKMRFTSPQTSQDTLKHLLMGVNSSNSLYFHLHLLPTALCRQ